MMSDRQHKLCAASFPENRTRAMHIAYIRILKRKGFSDQALKYWLEECPRISKLVFIAIQ